MAAKTATDRDNKPKLEVQLIKKMSIKGMDLDAKAARKLDNGTAVFLCRIFGICTDRKTKEDRMNKQYSYFVGDFGAITSDGRKFESNVLFMPGEMLDNRLQTMLTQSDGHGVEFAYDVFSVADDSSTVGYVYTAQAVVKEAENNRMKALMEQASQKALPPAPKGAK